MPQWNKKEKADRDRARENKVVFIGKKERIRRQIPYLVISLVITAVVVFVGITYYQQYVTPFRSVVIKFDNDVIRMRYFLERVRVSGSGGISMLTSITNERLVRVGASRYGITVTDADIIQDLRRTAAGGDNITITDAEFNEWYRQLLDSERISSAGYREIISDSLLMDRFMEYLAQSIPTNPEHAHVYGIFVSSYDEAVKAKERLEAGESFSKLVAELSIDPSKENGGDLGWFPKGVSVLHQDPFELKVGQIGDALAYAESTTEAPSVYYVITVTEFASRELDAKFLPELKSKTFQDWLTAENKEHTVKFTYNSEIDAWVNWQLSKAKSSTDSGS